MDIDAVLPGPDDVAFYAENGYWISPVVLPDELLDAAGHGMRRWYAGERDSSLPDVPGTEGWGPQDGEVLRKNDYASLRLRELARLATFPAIGAIAATLSGSASIRLWHDQLLYKPVHSPGAPTKVGWHTDRQYWLQCSSEHMLTAWVGFHDVSEVNGGVGFLPGSHRWDVRNLDFWSQDTDALLEEIRRQGHPVEPVWPELRRGQVSFHHCRTVHGSGHNRGAEPRRALTLHLQPGDNHWQEHRHPNGTLTRHPNDGLVRTVDGRPDYTDPDICPRLWPVS